MSQRQHAYDFYREEESAKKQAEAAQQIKMETQQPPLDQIPLNIMAGGPSAIAIKPINKTLDLAIKNESKKARKKKNKKDDKPKKKKRKNKKKKSKNATSSSSSTSDSDSDSSTSESGREDKDSKASSIRVAMRKFWSQSKDELKPETALGKWTMVASDPKPVPPPAPTISENQIKEKKRDDLIIQQWTSPEPIITPAEKQLLEKLKGRLKGAAKEKEDVKKSDSKSVEKSKSSKDTKGKDSRERSRSVDRRRERERERNRSRERRSYRGRRSSYSRERSRSNDRRRYRTRRSRR